MPIQRRGLLWESTVDIVAARVRTWHSIPIEAAPAPGIHRVIRPLRIDQIITPGSQGFSAAENPSITISATIAGAVKISSPDFKFFAQLATRNSNTIIAGTAEADDLSAEINIPLLTSLDADLTAGAIASKTINAAGLLYAALDTGHIIQGANTSATYRVDTVGGGGNVLTFTITNPGNGYTVANGLDTDTSGAGGGFKVNITGITQGNGSVRLITHYVTPRID